MRRNLAGRRDPHPVAVRRDMRERAPQLSCPVRLSHDEGMERSREDERIFLGVLQLLFECIDQQVGKFGVADPPVEDRRQIVQLHRRVRHAENWTEICPEQLGLLVVEPVEHVAEALLDQEFGRFRAL